MTIEQFIESISTIPYRSIEKEFDFAKQNQALVTPHLLSILEDTLESLGKEPIQSRSAHVFAIYLLALFREQKAYPLIIELLSNMPNSFEHSLFNDELEDMPNILASTFNGNIEHIYKLIENTSAYLFARIAALDTLVALWHTQQISREFVIAYFDTLLKNLSNDNKDTEFQPWIIHSALRLYPEEIMNTIRLAFYFLSEDLYCSNDPLILPHGFEKAMKKGKDYVFKKYLDEDNFHIITSLAEEFEDWCWFSPERQYLFQTTQRIETVEVVEEDVILEEEDIEDEEEIMFVGDDKHMAYCHKLYGDFNEKGLESLQDKYDTIHLHQAKELARELQYHASELNEGIELMEQASRELIYGESPFRNDYKIDEQGDIGDFASELYEAASSIEDIISQISKKLAPLGRLLPIEPDDDDKVSFHKEVEDWLDDPKGYQRSIHAYFD